MDFDEESIPTGLALKQNIQKLTNVPIERQKITGATKAGFLKDDQQLKDLKLKDKQVIKVIGSADTIDEAPKEKIVFAEDLPEDEKESAISDLPPGFVNTGNTCYLNSSLHLIRNIPELKSAIVEFNSTDSDPTSKIVSSLRDSLNDLNKKKSVTPNDFTNAFRAAYPQFAEKSSTPFGSVYSQQDADEFVGNLLYSLNSKLDASKRTRDLFTGEMQVKVKCVDNPEEPPVDETESFVKLSCFIDQDVNNLGYGLEKSLTTTLEKFSPSLKRDAHYQKAAKISKLPPYLLVNFVRFFWKAKEQVKAKILKEVKFPIVLDAYELCTEDYKAKMKVVREKLRDEKEKEIMNKYKAAKEEDTQMKDATSTISTEVASSSSSASEPVMNGWYKLIGVVTHQGRTANSGHYIAWICDEDERWIKFDDDKVTQIHEEEVKKLSGGGDWHMAYILLYKFMTTAP